MRAQRFECLALVEVVIDSCGVVGVAIVDGAEDAFSFVLAAFGFRVDSLLRVRASREFLRVVVVGTLDDLVDSVDHRVEVRRIGALDGQRARFWFVPWSFELVVGGGVSAKRDPPLTGWRRRDREAKRLATDYRMPGQARLAGTEGRCVSHRPGPWRPARGGALRAYGLEKVRGLAAPRRWER